MKISILKISEPLESSRRTRLMADEIGTSLLELLVAGLISLLIVGGAMTMLIELNDIHRDTQQLIDTQQAARIAMDQLQRDIQIAGVGLLWLLPPTPVIIPRADGGIDIRQNQGGIMAAFVADMAGNNDAFSVDDVTGFMPGMQIAVYDAGGSIDFVSVTSIDTGNDRISHTGASKAYTVANGTAVARILTVSYFLQNNAGVFTMVRQEDNGAIVPIAGNIVPAGTSIIYWDDSLPTVQFNPTTNLMQLRIRTVEVTLEVETEDVKLNTTQKRSTTLTTRMTPRAMVLS